MIGSQASELVTHLTVDQAVGIAVKQYLFINAIPATKLASVLELSSATVSRKLRGLVGWSTEELMLTAAFLNISVQDLIPQADGLGGWLPAPYRPARGDRVPELVPQVGLEPTTDGL
ncbi:helix-turn-helix domain-containing protein [Schaalia hyovaginalis]|uniref:helix-turn-helix domain-containing protein n=1 Tax=Schaalia hyovaginalis TaxID=29316 RepID=UPI0016120392